MIDLTENSCYWSRFGHERRPCPSCVDLAPCPKCGGDNIQKVVGPGLITTPQRFVRCNKCDYQTDLFFTFKESLENFYGKAIQK